MWFWVVVAVLSVPPAVDAWIRNGAAMALGTFAVAVALSLSLRLAWSGLRRYPRFARTRYVVAAHSRSAR